MHCTMQPWITFDEISHLKESGLNGHKIDNAYRIESNKKVSVLFVLISNTTALKIDWKMPKFSYHSQ